MSPEAIHSLIKLFGVEKGIHMINMFTAMDDLELTQQYRLTLRDRETGGDRTHRGIAGAENRHEELKVIVHQDKSTRLAAMNLLYDVGSRDEDHNKTGFAHLFEHLLFLRQLHDS